VGEHLRALPDEVLEVLRGVDLILHAGDLNTARVIRELEALAPVVAVRGNHDDAVPGLPRDVVVRAGGRRIGLTHGARPAVVELTAAALSLLAGRPVTLGFSRSMRARFGALDCLVTGHLHVPIDRMVGGVRHFSPGAVFVPESAPAPARRSWRERGYLRVRSGLPAGARVPAVGLLEVGPEGVRARAIPLRRPLPVCVG
jgi:putative phosphoesterase